MALAPVNRPVFTIPFERNKHISQLNQQISISTPEDDVVEGLFVMPYTRNRHLIGRDAYTEDLGTRLELEKRYNQFNNRSNLSSFRNKLYEIPHNVSSVFTGREDILQRLSESCLPPRTQDNLGVQRRFVLYGLGGSGKTQVCLKFAQDHRERYAPRILRAPNGHR
jgi:hypothetical protein